MNMTIDEAMEYFKVNTKEAIYMRVKRGQLVKLKKDGKTFYSFPKVEIKEDISELKKLEKLVIKQSNKIESLESEITDLKELVKELISNNNITKTNNSDSITEPNKNITNDSFQLDGIEFVKDGKEYYKLIDGKKENINGSTFYRNRKKLK